MEHLSLRTNRLRTSHLHPLLYRALLGFTALLVLASAAFYDHLAFGSLWYPVMIAFAVVALGLPYVLWRIWRHAGAVHRHGSFRDWAAGDVEVWQARLSGSDAAVAMLLPVAAVGIGMLALATVFLIVT